MLAIQHQIATGRFRPILADRRLTLRKYAPPAFRTKADLPIHIDGMKTTKRSPAIGRDEPPRV
jgi:hypothetical protein